MLINQRQNSTFDSISGYYGGQAQAPVPGGQQNYGYAQYSYGGQSGNGTSNPSDN